MQRESQVVCPRININAPSGPTAMILAAETLLQAFVIQSTKIGF